MNDQRFLPALRFAVALSGICLVASTWSLWTGSSSFPQVPFLKSLCHVRLWADRTCLAVILTGAVGLLAGSAVSFFDGGRQRPQHLQQLSLRLEAACPWVFAIGLALSVLLNQHRLQPWVWHFILLAPLLARPPRVLDLLNRGRPVGTEFSAVVCLTAFIYGFSAVSKLDSTFHATYGRQLVEALVGAAGGTTHFWPQPVQSFAAILLPLGEAAVAVLLVGSVRLLRFGFPVAIVMHLLLFVTLGPLGLNHEPAVLIWNGYFIAQAVVLWSRSQHVSKTPPRKPPEASLESSTAELTPEPDGRPEQWLQIRRGMLSPVLALLVLTAGLTLPFLRIFGYCDPWPAWAVYASQPARVTVLVDRSARNLLPKDLQRFLRPRQIDDGRIFFRVDLWSIDATGAPIYAGDRFPVAVASWLAEQKELQNKVDLVIEDAATWWNGTRRVHEYRGNAQIAEAVGRYRVNTRPRRTQ